MIRALCVLGIALVTPPVAGQSGFSGHWHDGRAELDGYRWEVTRYGQKRQGQAVMIFVTEPFSEAERVKVDDPSRNRADVVDVLKLNLVRDFQTGIYDYNTMTSIFARTSDFEPLKVSFSSAEWCGHVYGELLVDGRSVRERYASYFEGESAERTHDRPRGGILEDNLYILLRGLREPYLEPGGAREVPLLESAFHRRLSHAPFEWTTARIERLAGTQRVEVPAGAFDAIVYVVEVEGGREGRFFIEREYPHRIVRWQWGPGRAAERGELAGSSRVKYWRMNDDGDERYLDELGIAPLPANR